MIASIRSSGENSTLSKRSRSSQSSGSFAIVWVAFPYDRPDRLNIFWDDWAIGTIIWKPGLNVGNDDYIVLCNFDGLIISGLEAEEGRGLRTSPRPFTVAGSKKLTGLNFLFPSPIHTIWNRIPRSTGSPSQIEILISDWLVMEIFSIHFEIKCENFFICNTCVWHLVPSYRCPIVDYSEVLPWFVQLCRVTRLKKG